MRAARAISPVLATSMHCGVQRGHHECRANMFARCGRPRSSVISARVLSLGVGIGHIAPGEGGDGPKNVTEHTEADQGCPLSRALYSLAGSEGWKEGRLPARVKEVRDGKFRSNNRTTMDLLSHTPHHQERGVKYLSGVWECLSWRSSITKGDGTSQF